MWSEATGSAKGAVVVGILSVDSIDEVLRSAFPQAQRENMSLHVVIAAAAATVGHVVHEPIDRWAEKFPEVPLTVKIDDGIDAAITLAAAARRAGLLVIARPSTVHDAAVVEAVRRRVRCPLLVV